MRILLFPFSLLYGIIIFIRNKLYDFKFMSISSPNAGVISVGNVSTGGTGKTPMTEYLAEYFLTRNKSVAVVMKGYKRTFDDIQVAEIGYKDEKNTLTVEKLGDESLQILENLADIKTEQGKGLLIVSDDKRSGVRLADKKFKPEIIIIDDAFQHRSISRDLDIVMLNEKNSRLLLPAGDMREPLGNIKRANVLVLNKKFSVAPFSKLEAKRPGMIVSNYKFEYFLNAKEEMLDMGEVNVGTAATAFCGLADPDSFKELLENLKINVINFIKFPDHHNFTSEDIKQILDIFEKGNSKYIFTTQKDMIRLKYSGISNHEETKNLLFNHPLYYARIRVQISKNEDELNQTLEKFIQLQ
jgi:tetraacyldisaccharide 4'-kinase